MKTIVQALVMLIALAAGPTMTLAQDVDCLNYEEYIHFLGYLHRDGDCRDLAISGDHAYVLNHGADGGLLVIDISTPSDPKLVAVVEAPMRGIEIVDDLAFIVGDADPDFAIFDIADPTTPELVGSLEITAVRGEDVVVRGQYAFLIGELDGVGAERFNVIDVSDPSSPVRVSDCWIPTDVQRMAMAEPYIYVLVQYGGLGVIDVSDPLSPVVVGGVQTGGDAYDLAVRDGYAYVADISLQVVDVSSPHDPFIVNTLEPPCHFEGLAVDDGWLYCTDHGNGSMRVYDIGEPAQPKTCGFAGYTTGFNKIAVSNDVAYIAGTTGLHVIDVSEKTNPPFQGDLDLDTVGALAAAGNYAYAGSEQILHVVDLVDPASPVVVGSVALSDYAEDVAIAGDHAFVALYYAGFEIVDISQPASPWIVGGWPEGGTRSIDVSGDFVYLANGNYGCDVFDISTPSSPMFVVTIPSYMIFNNYIDVNGDYLYIAAGYDDQTGLVVFDVTDPASAVMMGSVMFGEFVPNPYGYVEYLAVAGDLAFVGIFPYTVVISISDPQIPTVLGYVRTPCSGGIAVAGSHAYVGMADYGLGVVDVSDPMLPVYLGAAQTPGRVYSAAATDDLVLVGGHGGLQVVWRQCESVTSVPTDLGDVSTARAPFRVYPNPFNPQTTITFSLERDEWATVSVFELTGRRVALLTDRAFNAGTHSLTWSGRDEAGRSMPSGTYLVRLETESAVRAQKLMLLR